MRDLRKKIDDKALKAKQNNTIDNAGTTKRKRNPKLN